MSAAQKKGEEFKAAGNKLFAKGDYEGAVKEYTRAIQAYPEGHVYYSNRSACFVSLNKLPQAIADGESCIKYNPSWAKGYYRLGHAQALSHDWESALATLKKGASVDPSNQDIKNRLREVETEYKKQKATRDKYAGMSPAMAAKAQGNEFYKAARFPDAIEAYSRGYALATTDKEKIDLLNNRAACNMQERSFRPTIRDCTEVLEMDEVNPKALLRRGLAYESIEKIELALADMKKMQELYPGTPKVSEALHRLRKQKRLKEGHGF